MGLPPGQRRIEGFPRFGVGGRPPSAGEGHTITIGGPAVTPFVVSLDDLAALPRRELVADFHCVSGWTATGVHWEGVRFSEAYDRLVRPHRTFGAEPTHVVLEGLDGYRAVALLEDLCHPDVLLADRLDGRPLDHRHGAPVRLVSPEQYGFISTKHLCGIELHPAEPLVRYHPSWRAHLGLSLVKPHPRARVRQEERHRYLPGWAVRPVYRRLIRHFKSANERHAVSP